MEGDLLLLEVSLMVRYAICKFFFSSRRRHTNFKCDWSSDVCSSDLLDDFILLEVVPQLGEIRIAHRIRHLPSGLREPQRRTLDRKSVRVGKECRSRWSPYH